MLIGETVAEIWPFCNFFKMVAVCHLGFVLCVFDDHCHCAKFGWNQCSGVDNMQVLIFCILSLKMPIHAHKIGFLGDLTPKMGGGQYERDPKRHFLVRKHVV